MGTYPDHRIPLKPNSAVRGNMDTYIIEQFCFATKYALVYMAHTESAPENRCALMELYPCVDVRMDGLVHRTDAGPVHIYSPFSAVLGTPDDEALLEIYLKGLYEEAPTDAAFAEPVLFTDPQGGHYQVIKPAAENAPNVPLHNPLPLIPEDELVSYVLLHKHPLYRYRDENGEIHILCVGSGIFMKRMILSILSCGQMLDTTLHIHILSKDSARDFTSRMLATAPLLEGFTNLVSENKDCSVRFHFQQISDIKDENILADLPYARYVLISMGDSDHNSKTAMIVAQRIAANPAYQQRDTMIHYYCADKKNNRIRQRLPQWIQAKPFSEDLSGYREPLQDLGRLTIRLAHMYNKLQNPKISLNNTEKALEEDAYGQKSSCGSALHLKYKLSSVGIDPELSLDEIIPAYQKVLQDPVRYARLLANEHLRWMFYMAADQYRIPAEEDLIQYGFAYEEMSFNGSWKTKSKRLHPCLVPCSDAGIVLTPKDFQTYNTREAIANAPFDPLDKMSLLLHLLAEEKCREILRSKTLNKDFLAISTKLLAENGDVTGSVEALQSKLAETEQFVLTRAGSLQYDDHKPLDQLQQAFITEGIDISPEVAQFKNRLSIFVEYAHYKDYKKPDETIVQMLPWVLYGEDLKLIMLCNQTVSASIAAPLLMDPAELVFLGPEEDPSWTHFFQDHGLRAQVRFHAQDPDNTDALKEALRREVAQSECRCVIDITDADEVAVVAAHQLCLENDCIALIRATDDHRIENVKNFPPAAAYSLNTLITAEDIFALHGAKKIPDENQYMDQLCDLMPTLWQMYQDFQTDWNMIAGFFGNPRTKPVELYMSRMDIRSCQWEWYEFRVEQKKFRITKLEDCLRALQENGILQTLQIDFEKQGKQSYTRIRFRFPNCQKNTGDLLNRFFSEILPKASGAYTCHVWEEDGNLSFEISNGRRLYLEDYIGTFRDANMNTYPYQQMIPVLKYMHEHKLLHELSISVGHPTKISFSYAHPELRTCLSKAGNLLEFHIYNEARKTGFFDDIQANFTFIWKEESVRNELDLILTAGFKNLFVSAKSGGWKKEQLYEIKYLTDRFSVNSIPVIIYSSDKVFEDGRITRGVLPLKQRAKAMGVHLIDLNALECPLGEKLVQIVKSGHTVSRNISG